jgi:hypothetical protein
MFVVLVIIAGGCLSGLPAGTFRIAAVSCLSGGDGTARMRPLSWADLAEDQRAGARFDVSAQQRR